MLYKKEEYEFLSIKNAYIYVVITVIYYCENIIGKKKQRLRRQTLCQSMFLSSGMFTCKSQGKTIVTFWLVRLVFVYASNYVIAPGNQVGGNMDGSLLIFK